ncbi:hypothetical protein Mgra_00005891 [Meloidogyne graminicola]|uniref:Transporter n=1 Tax=Meloidogyne graminicola TaxID=189291 RepID=A0A8S9ZNG5_9BILA|nr:hypothetical protein Mgra_00005891 [Meloidogyne graminicola]
MAKKWFSRGAKHSHELVPSSEGPQQQQSLRPAKNNKQGPTDMALQKNEINGDDNLLHDTQVNQKGGGRRKVSILGHELLDRGQWSGQFDFLMSMIAYAVGLGNVWRFPYLCFKNGGGSFLVVYALFFAFGAVPIFIMEVTVGQYLQRGAMEMWKMCPIFKGVGIGNVVIAFMCIAYFCVIVSWAVFYMISSFNSTFPWETCDNYWNNGQCVTGNESPIDIMRITSNLTRYGLSIESSVEQYWERRVLKLTPTISDIGGIQWELLGLMFLSWVIVYFALWKGITQARKFVYFCAIFPYFLIVVLLIRGLTLPGAMTGISFYLTPNLTKLTETTVWKDAGTQVFYSYGVGFGTLIALGSHNKFNHNCYRDAIIMCFINGMTSILAGFAIFSILGYMSFVAAKPIAEIVKPGVGLAFLAYPEVASNLPLKQLWAFLFFLMITILGLDSQVCMLEGLFTALEDSFPTLLRKYKKVSLLFTCLFFFIIGIPMVTYAGSHWLTLVDAYGASGIALLFVVFFEVVGLAWGFGTYRVRKALKEMVGFYPLPCFNILWKYTAPLSALILFICCLVMYEPLRYPTGKHYPYWAEAFGFTLSSCSMIVIPGYALYYLFNRGDNLSPLERFRRGIHPPSDFETNRKGYSDEELEFIDKPSRTPKGVSSLERQGNLGVINRGESSLNVRIISEDEVKHIITRSITAKFPNENIDELWHFVWNELKDYTNEIIRLVTYLNHNFKKRNHQRGLNTIPEEEEKNNKKGNVGGGSSSSNPSNNDYNEAMKNIKENYYNNPSSSSIQNISLKHHHKAVLDKDYKLIPDHFYVPHKEENRDLEENNQNKEENFFVR